MKHEASLRASHPNGRSKYKILTVSVESSLLVVLVDSVDIIAVTVSKEGGVSNESGSHAQG